MRTYYVRAMDLASHKVVYYSFPTPMYGDNPNKIDGVGFYRTIGSLNAFFHGGGSHYRNWTDKNLYSLKREDEMKHEVESNKKWDIQPTGEEVVKLDSLFAFYRHIGYDYKAKKYTNGEKFKRHPKLS